WSSTPVRSLSGTPIKIAICARLHKRLRCDSVEPRYHSRSTQATVGSPQVDHLVGTESDEPAASRKHVRPFPWTWARCRPRLPGPSGGDDRPAAGISSCAAQPGRGCGHHLQRGTRGGGRGELGEAAQGSVPPRV